MKYPSVRNLVPALVLASIAFVGAPLAAQTTPILTFPDSEGRFGYFGNSPADVWNFTALSPGQTETVFDAKFDPTTARNPMYSSPGGDPWSTPAFYGGYQLVTTNNSSSLYLPNFVRGVVSPSSGAGYADLPVSQIFAFSNDGTVTNTVSGAFVTPTGIADGGTFHVELPSISYSGASATFRGVAFDGSQWVVTDDSAVISSTGATTVDIATGSGWRTFDPTDFSIGSATTLSGPISESGVWFQATKTAEPNSAVYDFGFSDVTYSADRSVPDDNSVALLLAVAIGVLGIAVRRRRALA